MDTQNEPRWIERAVDNKAFEDYRREPLGTRSWRCLRRWRVLQRFGLSLFLLSLNGVPGARVADATEANTPAAVVQAPARLMESRMWMTIGEHRFAMTLADSEAARAFVAMLPLTLDMEELNGNEKHGELPKALPTAASRPGTIRNGDILLWGSRTLVVFYQTFDSSYSYTRVGRVDDPTGLAQTLGRHGMRVTFSKN